MGVKKGTARVSEDTEVELARAPLQAILLADSFAQKFRPITLERPKVFISLPLLVIANICIYMLIYMSRISSLNRSITIMILLVNFGQQSSYCHDFFWTVQWSSVVDCSASE